MTPAEQNDSSNANDAYLFVKEGNASGQVYHLSTRLLTTIGRSSTNKIVMKDDVASRKHCEISFTGRSWVVRDLSSRNGTFISGQRIIGDHELKDDDMMLIGDCRLYFSLTPPSTEVQEQINDGDAETAARSRVNNEARDSDGGEESHEPEIVERRKKNRYLHTASDDRARSSAVFVRLYRLALKMAESENISNLSLTVLQNLIEPAGADIGAVLLFPTPVPEKEGEVDPEQLEVVGYRSMDERPYEKVSNTLSKLVLSNRESILANDVNADSRLSTQDSMAEIRIQSVICTPVQTESHLYGLIHLYCTNIVTPLDGDALDFALAVADQFAVALENLSQRERLQDGLDKYKHENQAIKKLLSIESEIIGESPAIQRLSEQISRLAPTDATALIRGESGAGKELVARAIHFNSGRNKGQYVCMNCAALSESLLESELFGHEKGSFTGATNKKIGKFEQADGGTLFLDEVGEMSPAIQAKFLRVLEGHAFERVGGNKAIQTDVRVVAATNRDLEEAVQEGEFRKDLYFRLNVMEIQVPSLKERRTDIPILANHFVHRLAEKSGRPIKQFTSDTIEELRQYDWPGNVRELKNLVERAYLLSEEEFIRPIDLNFSTLEQSSSVDIVTTESFQEKTLEDLERQHILNTLEHEGWNKSRSAQILGIERSTLDRKLKRYGVNRPV